jgi:KUP system potassium uptake protein
VKISSATTSQTSHHNLISLSSLIITLGIIYGDIGTSPLYVMKAIIGNNKIDPAIIIGAVSCVFYTLTIQTTIKYVLITIRADNHGEGGIFSLYSLLKRLRKGWIIIPAIIGGCALLADGIITPSISISSAVEGLKIYYPQLDVMIIVIVILFILFSVQRFGTQIIGKSFGPIMLLWFLMLGSLGLIGLFSNISILKAFNPYYAFKLLQIHNEGFYVLGFVFLCTTGAEALYSDLGHCGVRNVRISWIFVKSMLVINYFGQGAMMLNFEGKTLAHISGDSLNPANPFYMLMPEWFLPIGIVIATFAAIIASQALITGSFSLISEAIRLDIWPKITIHFPTSFKGQILYTIN